MSTINDVLTISMYSNSSSKVPLYFIRLLNGCGIELFGLELLLDSTYDDDGDENLEKNDVEKICFLKSLQESTASWQVRQHQFLA